MRFSRFALNRNRARIRHTPGNFSVDRAVRVNYAPLRERKITRVFAAAVATGGREEKGGECGVEISRCFDRDLSGCFGWNHPGTVTTIIFAAPHRLPRCNQFRRRITLLRLSRRLQRLRNESEIGRFEASTLVNSSNSIAGCKPVIRYISRSKPRDKIEIPRISDKLSGKFNQIRGTNWHS